MEIEQIKEYCQEALKIAEHAGTHASLSYLIGEKFGSNFALLRKVRRKLQFLYSNDNIPEEHPLNQGARTLKMSYALTVQEHYSVPIEQVKHLESLLENFSETILTTFSQEEIKNYLESSPIIGVGLKEVEGMETSDMESEAEFSVDDLLLEAEEILALEDIKKLLLQDKSG
jgi:hypothetical protein